MMGFDKQYDDRKVPQDEDILAAVKGWRRKRVYINTCSEFLSYSNGLCNLLIPQPPIKERIKQYTDQFAEYTVGVHIRRTDNVISVRNSPLEMFLKYMHEEVRNDSRTKFFLSTDDLQVKKEIEAAYPDRIITQHNPVRRDTGAGMIDAVVDLWCLKHTNKLLGSYWSSFTDLAIRLGNMPYTIVRNS